MPYTIIYVLSYINFMCGIIRKNGQGDCDKHHKTSGLKCALQSLWGADGSGQIGIRQVGL